MKSYPFAIVFSLTAVVVGLVLQLSLGSISKSWFSFPDNVVGGGSFCSFDNDCLFPISQNKFYPTLLISTLCHCYSGNTWVTNYWARKYQCKTQ